MRVAEKCWREVLEKSSVGEEVCRQVLEKRIVDKCWREVLYSSAVQKCWRRTVGEVCWRREL